jgi:hypothetical protein
MPAQIWPMYVPNVNASTEPQTVIVQAGSQPPATGAAAR